MPDRIRREFPLFPLGLVALPSEYVPLHIFEERFKALVEACLELPSEFGIVWLSDEELKVVGCACRIERVLERMPDGRVNILTRGTTPFRLVERQDGLPYPAGVVELLEDEGTYWPGTEAEQAARAVYADLVEQATDSRPEPEVLAKMGAYEMAGTIEFGLDAKQQLLEMRSETERLELLTRLLRATLGRLSFVDRAETRARSNGKVRFG
jgi:Lon protease-like protein